MGTLPISIQRKNAYISSKRPSKATILVALLFLAPLLAAVPPPATVDEAPKLSSQRSTDPDVAVTDLNVTTPSAMVSGVPTLAPINHIIRVSIVNLGGSTAEGNLTLKVNSAIVDNRTVSINPGQQEVHLLYWDATNSAGSSKTLTASWEPSSSDSDSSNDEQSLTNVQVVAYEEASDIADSLPDDGSSLARALWVGAITVVNTGNQPVNVTADITLTPLLGGPSVDMTSSTELLSPGSLSNPPEPQNVTISFDGSNLEGNYTLGGSLLVIGETQSVVTIDSRIVNFMALRASLIPANNRNVDPGSQTILNFILQNSGTVSDDFTVTQTNTSAPDDYWANVSNVMFSAGSPLTVAAGETEAIQVPVDVPADAANGEAVIVTVSVQSMAAGYVLDASTVVMAGGTYQSEIHQNHSHSMGLDIANITPGNPKTLDYTLKNTGTAPTQFQINVGATEPVPYWTIESPISITDVVMPNETRTIPVTITTPALEMPLNPSWKVSSIEQVNLMIQAIPLDGGIPATNQTTLMIDSVVELDVQITGGANDVTVDDIISGNTNRYVDFEVRIVHNLGSNSTLAQVSLSPTSIGGGTGKTFIGDTPLADSSTSEHTRWVATAAPSTMELEPGEIGYGKVGISFDSDHDFPYPSAGLFTYSFTATSDWGSFPGTISRNSSASVSLNIEEMWSAELISTEVSTGDPDTQITNNLTLKNTGNDVANFTVGYVPIPGWDISLGSTAVNLLKSRTNLYPVGENDSQADRFRISVQATPPPTASADKIHEVWVYVNSTETGELIAYAPALFQLTEVISAEIAPANSTAVISSSELGQSRVGQTTIILQLNNTGNSNVTYDLTLHNLNPLKIDISFDESEMGVMEKPQTVAPGAQAIVRIYATAGTTARADIDSKFEVSVSSNGSELDRSGIVVQVAPDHAISFLKNNEWRVAPGNTIQVPVVMVNNGNLMETLNLTVEFAEDTFNWTYSVNESNFSIDPGQSHEVTLTITLPGLNEGGSILEAYVVHDVTLRAVNITDPFPTWPSTIVQNGTLQNVPVNQRKALGGGVPAGTDKITIEILPVFDVQLIEGPDRIALVPGVDRTIQYVLQNQGNAAMDLTLQWETTDSDPEQPRFGVEAMVSSTTLSLDVGQTTPLGFRFSTLGADHYKDEPGSFILTRTPIGLEIDPQIDITPIQVVRAQTDDEFFLSADDPGEFACENNVDVRCRQIEIPWVNINPWGSTNSAERTFTLALNGKRTMQANGVMSYDSSTDLPQRLVNSNFWSQTEWSMNIDAETETGSAMCVLTDQNGAGITATSATASICNSPWDLDASTPYDLDPGGNHGGTIIIQVLIPDKKSLAPGDGWDIYLQIRNPEEETNTQFSTDLVVKLRMTESTDPLIQSVSFRGEGIEGESTWIDVKVINAGNAMMPSQVLVSLDCPDTPYATIRNQDMNMEVPSLEAGSNHTASWEVTLNPIPWFSASETLDCTARIVIPSEVIQQGGVFGNVLANDVSEESLEIGSWSTPSVEFAGIELPSAALAALVILFFALSLLRQGLDDDQNRLHASAYIASMAFGTLSLSGISTILTIACACASIFSAGFVAWLSSSELQAIHDDRKKSKIGTRALIEDHDEAQANTRKELRAIISCAPYAFMPFVLISPSLAIDLGITSIASVLGYMLLSPILVHLILRFLDKSYDTLYSDLADIELRAIRIKKILGRAGQKPGSGGA